MKKISIVLTALFYIVLYLSITNIAAVLISLPFEGKWSRSQIIFFRIGMELVLSILFFGYIVKRTTLIDMGTGTVHMIGFLWATLAAIALFIVLDGAVEPLVARTFKKSMERYKAAVSELLASPGFTFLKACLIAPVAEELLMRGIVLTMLLPLGVWQAVVISSLLFAVIHLNLCQAVSGFLAGFVLGSVFVFGGSIWYCIWVHAIFNFCSLLSYLKHERSVIHQEV